MKSKSEMTALAMAARDCKVLPSHPMSYRLGTALVESAYALAIARGVSLPEMVRKLVEEEIARSGEEIERGMAALAAHQALSKA